MPRKFEGGKLVIASHNPGKVREIGELLEPFGADVVSVGELGLPEPVEDGETFIDNAQIKALAAATASGHVALADDSGLCVHALGDNPGVYSARWAGPDKDFSVAMEKVETAIIDAGAEDRSAHFACALTLAWPDGHTESFEGQVHGHMTWPPRGEKGFGYDPTFIPDGFETTFAEMEPQAKHAMSHRANAFKLLVAACFEDA
ncbi:RdgB/HAM1 family non-canonical purine NTP pyrophosphatase [Magnetovibrio sp. PR-2]|uniref:RdgB/HAM1 family non-canonical purine NTP pyrophosphatase n=1 Tax=Magnetovibrio sp. PR-2 TaxID=3120356 RepID=UPI002FCE459D